MRQISQQRTSLENPQETKGCAEAEKAGWHNIKVLKRGWPDRLMWRKQVYVWVEFKRPGKTLREQQGYRARQLERQGERVLMIDRWDKLVGALEAAARA